MSDDVKLEVKPAAQTDFVITDSKGRSITLRKPPFVAQFDLIDQLGDSASNETLRGMVVPLLYVCAIDGDPVARPNNKATLRALWQRLDDTGYVAVSNGLIEHFSEKPAGEDAVKND